MLGQQGKWVERRARYRGDESEDRQGLGDVSVTVTTSDNDNVQRAIAAASLLPSIPLLDNQNGPGKGILGNVVPA